MFERYLPFWGLFNTLLTRYNTPNKTTSKKSICKWCVENNFSIIITTSLIFWNLKKRNMQCLNQQFFFASIHLTSGCYWLWNERWECAQEVLMRQTFHGDTQLPRFIIVNIGKEPHSSYCQEKTSNLTAFFLREREREELNQLK